MELELEAEVLGKPIEPAVGVDPAAAEAVPDDMLGLSSEASS